MNSDVAHVPVPPWSATAGTWGNGRPIRLVRIESEVVNGIQFTTTTWEVTHDRPAGEP